MSTRSQSVKAYQADPFLCHKNSEEDLLYPEYHLTHFDYSANDFFLCDQYCPSSSNPSSPGSVYSSQSSTNLYNSSQESVVSIKQEPSIKEEPFDFLDGYPSQLPVYDDWSNQLCELPLDILSRDHCDDLLTLYRVDSTCLKFDLPDSVLLDSGMDNGEDTDDAVSLSAMEVDQKPQRHPRLLPPATKPRTRKNAANLPKPVTKRPSPPAQAPVVSLVSSLDSVQQWKQKSAGFTKMGPTDSRSSSVTSGDANSSKTSTSKRLRDRSPTGQLTYTQRRMKNNIAVRKSREKKRQEINKFTEDHQRLMKQCEQLRQENEKLKETCNKVQACIVEDTANAPASAILTQARKLLNF